MPKPVRPAYHLYRWMWGSLDYIFPPDCGGCGESGHLWCVSCQQKVKEITDRICNFCGQPWNSPGLCFRCEQRQPNFTMLRSWALYEGPVQEAVQRLKYRRQASLGVIFTEYLYGLVKENAWCVDAVIPVPLGVARLQERGYNQAVLIAQPLALRIGKPCLKRGLTRVRETRSQVGLSYVERLANVSAAFEGNEQVVRGLHVLVVDDVATSSATLDACAFALLQAGASEVNCVTLARAI